MLCSTAFDLFTYTNPFPLLIDARIEVGRMTKSLSGLMAATSVQSGIAGSGFESQGYEKGKDHVLAFDIHVMQLCLETIAKCMRG